MSASGSPVHDVKVDFGARGDGTTDDSAAIQAALDAARTGGGGVVYLPPGTYMLSMAGRTGGGFTAGCALMYGGHTIIRGAGRDATVLRLLNAQPGDTTFSTLLGGTTAILMPWNVGQEQIGFEDLTLDGNAANQVDTQSGILMMRMRGVKVTRVRIRDVHATASHQTWCYYAGGATDVSHEDCEAIQISGTAGNGFGGYTNTHISYRGCRAIGLGASGSFGNGFLCGTLSREVTHVGCHAYLCGLNGFQTAGDVQNIVYYACQAGGVAADGDNFTPTATAYPFASNQNLGNNVGFAAFAGSCVHWGDCVAHGNASHGFALTSGTYLLSNCSSNSNGGSGFLAGSSPALTMTNLQATGNSGSGIAFVAATDALGCKITNTRLAGNTTAGLTIGGVNYSPPSAAVAAPQMPTSGTTLVNPFGFNATIYVSGGTVSGIAVSGANTGLASGAIRLPATAGITLTYTSAPAWTWFLE